jgi:hypothetical protein
MKKLLGLLACSIFLFGCNNAALTGIAPDKSTEHSARSLLVNSDYRVIKIAKQDSSTNGENDWAIYERTNGNRYDIPQYFYTRGTTDLSYTNAVGPGIDPNWPFDAVINFQSAPFAPSDIVAIIMQNWAITFFKDSNGRLWASKSGTITKPYSDIIYSVNLHGHSVADIVAISGNTDYYMVFWNDQTYSYFTDIGWNTRGGPDGSYTLPNGVLISDIFAITVNSTTYSTILKNSQVYCGILCSPARTYRGTAVFF